MYKIYKIYKFYKFSYRIIGSISKHFIKQIRKYNQSFCFTSFGAPGRVRFERNQGFNTTFKVQGQIYHKAGSLLPAAGETPKFLQIYFIGNPEAQVDQRMEEGRQYERDLKREIVKSVQQALHQNNGYIIHRGLRLTF